MSFRCIDLHCDTITRGKPDLNGTVTSLNEPERMFCLSRLPEGSYAQCVSIFVPPAQVGRLGGEYFDLYAASFRQQLETYAARMAQCRTAKDVEAAWQAGKCAAILTAESARALGGDAQRVEVLKNEGVKLLSLSWNDENEVASGSDTDRGITDFGREVIPMLEDADITLDVSHLNDRGFEDLLKISRRPFVATHSNARALSDCSRNLPDEYIQELVRRGGLMGLTFVPEFLHKPGDPEVGYAHVMEHLEHLSAIGAEDIAAVGSDFDGTSMAPELRGAQKLPLLKDYLLRRGVGEELVEKMFWKNALRFMKDNFKA